MFPEAIHTETTQDSEAKEAEHILATSVEEREEEQAVIPLTDQTVSPDVIMPDPPVLEATEATTHDVAADANDIPMAEDNAQPKATLRSEALDATEDIQPSTSNVATAPPIPHIMARAFSREGELISARWSIMTPPEAPRPQYDYHIEQRPQT